MVKENIQTNPVSDSPNNDAFEGIVELYYQIKGYITSSGKWFWKMSEGKHQRGYQDINTLAVNGDETIIVSVSSNFDDKLSYKSGVLNKDKTDKTISYFDRVIEYFQSTTNYNWLINEPREVKKVIAVVNLPKNMKRFKPFLSDNKICILAIDDIVDDIVNYLEQHKDGGLKVQNQSLRLLQILYYKKRLQSNNSSSPKKC